MAWVKKYEEWIILQAIKESKQNLKSLDPIQFEKYVEYVAMMTGLEDINSDWYATSVIQDNYDQIAQNISDEINRCKKSFYATAAKQEASKQKNQNI